MRSTTSWIARRIKANQTSMGCRIRAYRKQRIMKTRRTGSGKSERVEEGVE